MAEEVKPATDAEIAAIRMTLPPQAHQMSPAAMVMQLIARIDAERAARLAAEARVEALEKTLRKIDAELECGFVACGRCSHDESLSDLDCRETIRAALKARE